MQDSVAHKQPVMHLCTQAHIAATSSHPSAGGNLSCHAYRIALTATGSSYTTQGGPPHHTSNTCKWNARLHMWPKMHVALSKWSSSTPNSIIRWKTHHDHQAGAEGRHCKEGGHAAYVALCPTACTHHRQMHPQLGRSGSHAYST